MNSWTRVSRALPCPVCAKPDWCTVTPDGTAVCCMRTESDHKLANGGWLHKTGDLPFFGQGRPRPPVPPKKGLSSDEIGAAWARWAAGTSDLHVAGLAGRLGVTTASLRALGVCWAWPREPENSDGQTVWGFPMFNGAGDFVGMRLRSHAGGKWAIPGSRQGIFIPRMAHEDEALVVEGPTDAAAAVSLGFFALGRPSCLGGEKDIATFCGREGIKRVSVVADNDAPGVGGARDLCRVLGMPSRLVVLPAKDLREWVKNGATRDAVAACLAMHTWRA